MEINKNKIGLACGSALAAVHFAWCILVELGTPSVRALNAVLKFAFIRMDYWIEGYSAFPAMAFIVAGFLFGYAFGWCAAWVWNASLERALRSAATKPGPAKPSHEEKSQGREPLAR